MVALSLVNGELAFLQVEEVALQIFSTPVWASRSHFLSTFAVKRLLFSNSQVKHNALVVMQGKGNIRKPRYDPGPHQLMRSPLDHRVWLRSDSSSRRAAMDDDM